MKPSFSVGGVTFSTQEVMAGYERRLKDTFVNKTYYIPAQDGMFADDLAQHNQLVTRYKALAARTALDEMPDLGITDYKITSIVALIPDNKIVVDHAVLKLMTPDEMDGLLAHELAHLELKHKPGIFAANEFAADKRAAEITGKPEALKSALIKIDQFQAQMKNSSMQYYVTEGTERMIGSIVATLTGRGTGLYPPNYQRTSRLDQYADQIKAEREAKAAAARTPGA